MFIKDGKTLNETNCTQEFAGTKDKCMSNKSRIPPYSYGYAKSIYEKLEKYKIYFIGYGNERLRQSEIDRSGWVCSSLFASLEI